MDMTADTTWWWIATGALIAIELGTGTFYLLMLALGTAAAAIAAHLGAGPAGQMLSAALVGGGAVAAWYLVRRGQPAALPTQANPDVNLDIGGQVQVEAWNADGTARVHYRGANWTARYQGQDAPAPGAYVIRAVQGSMLLLDH
ncbi:NfeD family protein [Roseateles toxinivorans]|uniref:Membrane protein implicated in regulation of membrane protease activity n=1 Tax=Roseateles toxinivorans TaxID=270368 RepID=A0A4R6QUF5_9BURK|nr:NfeD family protein [Roseateles toxinivorans]TDP74639.1 membrane protein implicated in regulation of membrane protease activity [Roseateles toxinivorans]